MQVATRFAFAEAVNAIGMSPCAAAHTLIAVAGAVQHGICVFFVDIYACMYVFMYVYIYIYVCVCV
jgi:hypothetical protein